MIKLNVFVPLVKVLMRKANAEIVQLRTVKPVLALISLNVSSVFGRLY